MPEPAIPQFSDAHSVIALVRLRIRFVVILVGLMTAIAVAAAFLITPVYRSTVTMIAADDNASAVGQRSMLGGLGELASLAGVNLGSNQAKQEAEALLQSRQFTETFIGENALLPKLFPRRWDAERKLWQRSWLHPEPPTLYDGFMKFDDNIRVLSEDKKTGIVTLDIDWTDREEGARWANELVRRVNAAMRQRAMKEAEASIDLLTAQLQRASQVELQQAIANGIEGYVKQRTLASVRPEYAFRVIDPALAPDPDDFVWPERAVFIVLGPFVGFLCAVVLLIAGPRLSRTFGRSN
jgi:uncharacterized protein involved in exopolysaccharide biosynthesis